MHFFQSFFLIIIMMERIGADDDVKLVIFKWDFLGIGFEKMKILSPCY